MKSYRKYHPDYERDETGRIPKLSQKPFDVHKAAAIWSEKFPDPSYRRDVFSEIKKDAESKGELYTAQCLGDLLEVEHVADK